MLRDVTGKTDSTPLPPEPCAPNEDRRRLERTQGTAVTKPAMQAVRLDDAEPDSRDEGGHRAPLMPPEPSADAPVVRISTVESDSLPPPSESSRSLARPSLMFRSILPESSRDTDEPRSTELDLLPGPLGARDRVLLLRLDGTQAGAVCSLGEETLLLGRHPSNAISVDDPGVSRVHAAVYQRDGRHVAEDRDSRNGTFINGNRIRSGPLNDGDTLQLGPRVSFRYTRVDAHQEEVLRQLYESSKRDALTGAYNRQHFEERLLAEVAYALRHGAEVGLVLFDLDHFKRVNDTHGHPAGDTVLRHVSGLVHQRLRTEDVFSRVGGEEFTVILRGASLKATARVGERLRAAIATASVTHEGALIPISVSVGCASLRPEDENGGQALVEIADRRLYLAKNGGRNRVVSSD